MVSIKTWDVTVVLQETTAPDPFNFIVIEQIQSSSTSSLPTSSPVLSINDKASGVRRHHRPIKAKRRLLAWPATSLPTTVYFKTRGHLFLKISRFILGEEQPYFACPSESICPNCGFNFGFCSSAVKKFLKKSLLEFAFPMNSTFKKISVM